MLDIIKVDVYGQKMPINQIGSITTPEPRVINIQVWDLNNVNLIDAAIIDGASPVRILISVVLPLSMPVMATIGLFYAVYHWNEWFYASIYITDNELKPMQIILRGLLNQATMEGMENISFMEQPPPGASLRAALIIFSTVPILIVYPFIQRYFVKGIMIGGVKG